MLGLKRVGHLARVLAIAIVVSVVFGSLAHLIAAVAGAELYSVAIGDHVLPEAPVDSIVFSPLIIGAHVSWWVGLVGAPFVYWIAGGPSGDWGVSRVAKAASIGMVAYAFLWLAATLVEDPLFYGFGSALLEALLVYGHFILGAGLLVMARSLRRGRLSPTQGGDTPHSGRACDRAPSNNSARSTLTFLRLAGSIDRGGAGKAHSRVDRPENLWTVRKSARE